MTGRALFIVQEGIFPPIVLADYHGISEAPPLVPRLSEGEGTKSVGNSEGAGSTGS